MEAGKAIIKSLNYWLEKYQRKSSSEKAPTVSETPKKEDIDYSRMSLERCFTSGIHMATTRSFSPNYAKWYGNIIQRFAESPIITGTTPSNWALVKLCSSLSLSSNIRIDVNHYVPQKWKLEPFSPYRILAVKILHTTDNTKAKEVKRISDKEWLFTGLTEEYLHESRCIMLIGIRSIN